MKDSLLVLLCITCTLLGYQAEDPKNDGSKTVSEIYKGGFGIGDLLMNDANYVLGSYFSKHFEFNFGVHFERLSNLPSCPSFNLIGFYGDIGRRSHLFNNIYLAYGFNGRGSYVFNRKYTDPYDFGVFMAIECQLFRHFLISFKIYPYNYGHTYRNYHLNQAFTIGAVSGSYVF